MKKHYTKFISKEEMIKAIALKVEFYDTDEMVKISKTRSRSFFIIKTDGTKLRYDNFKKFLAVVCADSGMDIFYRVSFVRTNTYNIFSREDYFSDKTQAPEILETRYSDKYTHLFNEEDVSGSKAALVDLFKDETGIKLKKNQTFQDMLKDIDDHFEEK